MIVFEVAGRPVASSRTVQQRARAAAWRGSLSDAAVGWMSGHGHVGVRGPVSVEVVFSYRRTASTPAGQRWRTGDRPPVAVLVDQVLAGLRPLVEPGQVAVVSAATVHAAVGSGDATTVTVRALSHHDDEISPLTAITAGATR